MTSTACLVCFIRTVNGKWPQQNKKEKNPISSGTSSGHIKLKQSIFHLSISMRLRQGIARMPLQTPLKKRNTFLRFAMIIDGTTEQVSNLWRKSK
jgi:hypothetical protein